MRSRLKQRSFYIPQIDGMMEVKEANAPGGTEEAVMQEKTNAEAALDCFGVATLEMRGSRRQSTA